MSFLSFLSQKTYLGEFLRSEVILGTLSKEMFVFGALFPYYDQFVIFYKCHKPMSLVKRNYFENNSLQEMKLYPFIFC